MKIKNDPFKIIMKIVRKHYPNLKCHVIFTNGIEQASDAIGLTLWSANPKHIPVVLIDANLSVMDATDILAHELAHVILGRDKANHGPEWKKMFNWINREYNKEIS